MKLPLFLLVALCTLQCRVSAFSSSYSPLPTHRLRGTSSTRKLHSDRVSAALMCTLGKTVSTGTVVDSGSGKPHFLILPGFGNAQEDYINPFGQGEERSIEQSLARRGLKVHVMPLQRIEWLKVLLGIFSISFWLGKTTPYEPAYGWYVQRARQTLLSVADEAGGNGVVVLGHSAGGWLARAVIGDAQWAEAKTPIKNTVRALVTLGAPHSPPGEGSGAKDMTQGALTWTDSNFPGAHVKQFGVSCITVGSDLIVGDSEAERGTPWYGAFQSYKMVCGKGDVEGDGVVPLSAMHLDGADEITVQCYHSISPVGDPYKHVRETWYGSESMVDSWLDRVWAAVSVDV